MNFYPFHIGDYAAHTRNLSLLEDLAYRRLLDAYYLAEQPFNGSPTDVAREIGMRDQVAEVEYILTKFFEREGSLWRNKRADQEIAKYQEKQAKASKAGKASAERRLNTGSTDVEKKATDVDTQGNGRSTNQEPRTKNQEPEKKPTASSPAKLPTCPVSDLIALYHEILPGLPAVRLETESRKRALRKTWEWVLTSRKNDGSPRATNAQEALEWFRSYFERATENDFLMGRTPRSGEHQNWKCDLDFLLTERGMKHVIEKTQVEEQPA